MNREDAIKRAMDLPCWDDPSSPEILGGGSTNHNIKLMDRGQSYVVRVGGDILHHQVMRFNELACHQAAERVELSPPIVFAGEGVLAMEFVDGHTLSAEDIRRSEILEKIVPVIKRLHRDGTKAVRGPVITFWVFHVIRDYAAHIISEGSPYAPEMTKFLEICGALEQAVGPVDIVLGHNDLLPANFIDDGDKVWLLDWDYGGFNSPLFDLAGLASNAEFSAEQESRLLEMYFEYPVSDQLFQSFHAMKCASLLRETMWSMVSELHSDIDFDYPAYTANNRARFNDALNDFRTL